jgi:hypothetical protein
MSQPDNRVDIEAYFGNRSINGGVHKIARRRDASVVDQQLDLSQLVNPAGDRGKPLFGHQVRRQRLDLTTNCRRVTRQRFESIAPPGDGQYTVPVTLELSREHQTDPGRSAGDHGPSAGHLIVSLGPHRPCELDHSNSRKLIACVTSNGGTTRVGMKNAAPSDPGAMWTPNCP